MMSRITLHLRKQARAREADSVLAAPAPGTTTSTGGAGVRSRLRFTGTRSGASLDPLSVTVEETTVTHDDKGRVVGAALKGGGGEEWFEMRAPPPVRLASARVCARDERDPELRFVV